VFESTERTLDSPYASDAERELAHQQRITAIEGQIAATEIAQTMDRTMATVSFVSSATTLITSGIEMAQQRDGRMALLERCRMQVLGSIQNHEQSTQNGYYIRPLLAWPQGGSGARGCAIVDLKAGRMTKVWTSPFNTALFLLGMNLAPCAVSPSGDQIVTVGLGMDPSLYKPYVKHSRSMPYPSLMSFDPAKLAYVDIRAYEELSKGVGTGQESAEVGLETPGSVVGNGQGRATLCGECGAGNPEDAKFCHACGSSLALPAVAEEPSMPSCRACGAENPKGFKFCKRCGAPAA